ncbi:PREDICTED: fibrous sheath-interacting protein 2-like [Crocodylus porosus]|uniref:fibrous sheath-interacting protein 2-like n=1 Tax=Crocodylus porosus TaxID=8502 RepID=UPI00093C5A79|nr:PREDICTED: fibrous sheath-interacting protein 2-like [Crocodylus porosus]
MELFSRNSFQNVLEPDITRVELLKDVQTKEDLVVRLVVHDIENNEEEEQVALNLEAKDWEYDEEDDDEKQQEKEEKEISEDIIEVESSHLMMSLLTSAMDNEQLSAEEFEEASAAFQAQHKSTCASLCHTRDTKASVHSSKVDSASPSSHIASSMIRCCFNCFRSNQQKTPLRKNAK